MHNQSIKYNIPFSKVLSDARDAKKAQEEEWRLKNLKSGLTYVKDYITKIAQDGKNGIALAVILKQTRSNFSSVNISNLEEYLTKDLGLVVHPGGNGELYTHPYIKW
jgi:ribosomal protein L18E